MPLAVRLPLLLLLAAAVAAPAVWLKVNRSVTYRNLRVVDDGRLLRSGQMTPAGFARVVREYGVRTVISLRDTKDDDKPPPDRHEEEYAAAHGLAFHRLSPAKWSAPDGSVPATKNVAEFVRILRTADRPVLLHCFAGIHRTGAYAAVYRMEFDGWSAADAVAEMREIGTPRSTFEPDVLGFLAGYRPAR